MPWSVAIVRKSNGAVAECSASLIASKYILTAAHCFRHNSESNFQVVLGTASLANEPWNYEQYEKRLDIFKLHQHPQYEKDYYHDIAIIELEEELTFSEGIFPICLPSEASTPDRTGDSVSIVGYGSAGNDGSNNQLRFADLQVFGISHCEKELEPMSFTTHLLCAGSPVSGIGSCPGDSGGPLLQYHSKDGRQYYEQVAVVKGGDKGSPCGTKPGAYTRLDHPDIFNWVQKVVFGVEAKIPKLKTIEVKNSEDSYDTDDFFYVKICNPDTCCTANLRWDFEYMNYDFNSGNLDTFTDLNYTDDPEDMPGNCQNFDISIVTSLEVLRWAAGDQEEWLGDYIMLLSDDPEVFHYCTYNGWIPADKEWYKFSCLREAPAPLQTIEVKTSENSPSSNDYFYVRICNADSCCTANLDSKRNDFQSGNLDTFTNLNYSDDPEEIPGNCGDFDITTLASFEVMRWGYGQDENWLGDYIMLKSADSKVVYYCTTNDWIPADIEWYQFSCRQI